MRDGPWVPLPWYVVPYPGGDSRFWALERTEQIMPYDGHGTSWATRIWNAHATLAQETRVRGSEFVGRRGPASNCTLRRSPPLSSCGQEMR
jgi:hypothetical protein